MTKTQLKMGKKTNQKPYNKSLINFVSSVRIGKCLPTVFHTDLASSSLGLYENLKQILSCTDLALRKYLI